MRLTKTKQYKAGYIEEVMLARLCDPHSASKKEIGAVVTKAAEE